MRFTNEITIDQPAAEVFAYLADFENLPNWNYAIETTRQLTPGAVGIGTRYEQRRSLPRPMTEELEIVAYEPDRCLVVSGGFGPLHGTATYLIRSDGDTTTLVNEMDVTAHGVMSAIATVAGGTVRRAVAENLAVLKEILERR